MDKYVRDDGRFYFMSLGHDLFDDVVIIHQGGANRRARVRTIAVESPEAGRKKMEEIGAVRLKHHYERVS